MSLKKVGDRARAVSLGPCPYCGKKAYSSKVSAKANARRLYPGERFRVYKCRGPVGWWRCSPPGSPSTRPTRPRGGRRASSPTSSVRSACQADRIAAAGYLTMAVDLYSAGGTRKCLVSTMRTMMNGEGRAFASIAEATMAEVREKMGLR